MTEFLKYQGLTLTVGKWSQKLGIREATIRRRLAEGRPVEEALARYPRYGQPITYDGKTQTLAEWAKQLGLSKDVLEKRLQEGQTFVWAIQPEKPANAPIPAGRRITFTGTKQEIAQLSEELGLSRETLTRRVEIGKTPQMAFVPRGSKLIKYKGRKMSAIKWAKELGLTPQAIYLRLSKGLPISEVLTPKPTTEPEPEPKKKPKPAPKAKAKLKAKPKTKPKTKKK